jgi:hypothetical protein
LRLTAVPADFQFTRDQLHQIAFYAMAPARYAVEERMGLRATPGGFGTPEYNGRRARVEGNLLVFEQDGNVATQTITTIRAAAEFFGAAYDVDWYTEFKDPLVPMDPDGPLKIGDVPALALADWYRFGWEMLEVFGTIGTEADELSEIQLWPEHFDAATELGAELEGRRASYGASPGDKWHLEPYVYVSAWSEIDRSNTYWNDRHFNGSSLPYTELLEADDQVGRGVEFLTEGYRLLHR